MRVETYGVKHEQLSWNNAREQTRRRERSLDGAHFLSWFFDIYLLTSLWFLGYAVFRSATSRDHFFLVYEF